MNVGDTPKKLMGFIYDEYNRRDTMKSHGEYAQVILTRFIRETGIKMGDAGAQLEYIRKLYELDLAEVVSINGSKRIEAQLFSYSRIKPTPKGIEYIEQLRNPTKIISKAAAESAEIIGRAIKGFLGQ